MKPTRQNLPAQQKTDLVEYLQGLEPAFNAALTEQRMLWAKEFEYAKQALAKNDLLYKTASQEPFGLASFRAAIINVAACGITLNPIKKQAYLVPRGGLVCLDISYQGLIDLAVDAGSILWAEATPVYSNDNWKFRGVSEPPLHEYDPRNRGERLDFVYSLAKRHDGTFHVQVIDAAELAVIEKLSKAQSEDSPWKKWKLQMQLKTVIKRAAKWWPKVGDRFQAAVAMLNEQEGNAEPIMLDAPPTESHTLNALLEEEPEAAPVVDGLSVEDWILNAETREDFARTREMLRDLPPSAERVRLQSLWMYMRDEMAKHLAQTQAGVAETGA